MKKALLRLFNIVFTTSLNHPTQEIYRTIPNGYILDTIAARAVSDDPGLLDTIEEIIGISGEKANNAFHKSWRIIADSSDEALACTQIAHYMSTYGAPGNNTDPNNTNFFIPAEVLELPGITFVNDLPLIQIKGITDIDDIKARIINLDNTGIALSEQVLQDILTIWKGFAFASADVYSLKNREVKAKLSAFYDLVPEDSVEYLRFLVSKLTGESLLIKNKYLISKIKEGDNKTLDKYLPKAPGKLASIFLRYKPLFLAMKGISKNKTFFNQLRKKAKKMHVPIRSNYLDEVITHLIHDSIDLHKFQHALNYANIWRKIKLFNAINTRLLSVTDSVVYPIRNGTGWATTRKNNLINDRKFNAQALSTQVHDSIVGVISPKVANNTYFIPPIVHYALPSSEKQFTGNIPNGSYVELDNNMIAGIHWTNVDCKTVDLDLSGLSVSQKIGWDSNCKTEHNEIMFSGDITNAPKPQGATELFYVNQGIKDPMIFMVNYYNFDKEYPAPYKLFVAWENPVDWGQNYVVDPANIIMEANLNTGARKQHVLGVICNYQDKLRFYFANTSIGSSITSSKGDTATNARKFYVDKLSSTFLLENILISAGANVIDTLDDWEKGAPFTDLSPHALDTTTIIDLFS